MKTIKFCLTALILTQSLYSTEEKTRDLALMAQNNSIAKASSSLIDASSTTFLSKDINARQLHSNDQKTHKFKLFIRRNGCRGHIVVNHTTKRIKRRGDQTNSSLKKRWHVLILHNAQSSRSFLTPHPPI